MYSVYTNRPMTTCMSMSSNGGSNGGSNGVMYALGNGKPLISREQHYVLDRKLLSVHSEDRDITKWPHANTFDILLPEPVLNVQSLRLVQSTMPNFFYTFSSVYQNTQLQYTMAGGNPIVATIESGSYTPSQMANELTSVLNATADIVDGSFNVFYDEVGQKFWFGHTATSFTLNFGAQIAYFTRNHCPDQSPPTVFQQYADWGLPYYLGFQKQDYVTQYVATGLQFGYDCPCSSSCGTPSQPIKYYCAAPLSFQLNGPSCIYLEVDKYNNYDELYPYNQSSRQLYDNNAYNGKVNAAFAKIPLQGRFGVSNDSRTYFLQNMVQYDPPIERIARLKFRFRFHDGRLVDFQNYNFDFSLEFNSLRNEINKSYSVRIPAAYTL